MITSKKINFLLETYLTSKKVVTANGPRELVIYENPDTSERQDIILLAKKTQKGGSGPMIRIIADARPPQKVYVWDAYNAIHITAKPIIGLSSARSEQTPWLLYGNCVPKGMKFELISWDEKPSYRNIKFFDNFFSYKWDWLNKYVDTTEYFDDIKRWVETYRKTQSF